MAASARYKSNLLDYSPLEKPLRFAFSGRTTANRFLKASMTERISSWDSIDLEARGIPSTELINLYKVWGDGAFGMIITGNIHIEYDHLEASGNAIIPRDAPYHGLRFERFEELATQAKAHGCLIIGQANHPGRQVEDRIQKNPISASDVQIKGKPFGLTFGKPHAASEHEIKQIIDGFAHAAEYLEKAGFDGVQIHGGFGYLLAQFLSPTTNHRTDKYGGTLRNRMRLILEIAQEIQRRTRPDFILGIKLNSVEFQEGFSEEEAQETCQLLEEARFDFAELGGGTYEQAAHAHKRESTRKREAFFIEFAEKFAPKFKRTKIYITGGFKTVGAMVDALNIVDGVGLARTVSQEPHLVRHILDGTITGAIRQKIDEDDFGLAIFAAGTQIRQIAKGQEPVDLSSDVNVEAIRKEVASWGVIGSKNSDLVN